MKELSNGALQDTVADFLSDENLAQSKDVLKRQMLKLIQDVKAATEKASQAVLSQQDIEQVTIFERRSGTDKVFVTTNLPSPYTYEGGGALRLSFDATKGYGREYAKKHFKGIEIETVQDSHQ